MASSWMAHADALLRAYVDDEGRVHYSRLRDSSDLAAILTAIGNQHPDSFRSRDDALAFYLNAYNLAALEIALRLLRRDPRILTHGLKGAWAKVRFFFLERVRIASRRRTLFGLEAFIRRRFRDPRAHFALVCATASCPPLKHGVYAAERLREDLEAVARAFLRPGIGYVLDRETRTIVFSAILKWYRRDFRRVGGPLGAIARWAPPDDAAFVRENLVRVFFARYDWSLNRAHA